MSSYYTKVIISGYFNPLHKGHLDYINTARKMGSVYAIVNSDEQIKTKGSIPFLDEETRAAIIKPHVFSVIISKLDKDKSVAKTIESIFQQEQKNSNYEWILFNGGDVGTSEFNKTALHPKEQEICDKLGISIVYGAGSKIESSSNLIENAAKEWIRRKLGL